MMQQITEFVTVNWDLCLVLVIILFMLARTYQGAAYLKGLRPMEAVQKMNRQDALILDVRSDEEYKIGHISHSIHLPLDKLASRIVDLDRFKDKPIIIGCRSGNRSAQAGAILHKQGFGELYNLLGGIVAWQSANLPLTTKKELPANKKSAKSKSRPKKSKQKSKEKDHEQNSELPSAPNEVVIYTTQRCPYYKRAADLLTAKGVRFSEKNIKGDPALREEMEAKADRDSVPQIFIGDYHVGGYDELFELDEQGKLDGLLGVEQKSDLAEVDEV